MNTDKLMEAIGDISDRHVAEFAGVEPVGKKGSMRWLYPAISVAGVLVLAAVCMWGIMLYNSRSREVKNNTVTEPPGEYDSDSLMGEQMPGMTVLSEPILALGYVGTPYVILENLEATGETVKLYEQGNSYVNCVIVNCKVRYSFHADNELLLQTTVDGKEISKISSLTAILVPEKSVADFVSHEMVLINLQYRGGIGHLTGYDDTGVAEYWPIDNGVISISTYDCASFIAIYHLNEHIDRVAESAVHKELTEKDNAVPKRKLEDGMTLQEVIGYFDAYDVWSKLPN